MNVVEAILQWSQDKPVWIKEALRLILEKDILESKDFDFLTEVCKGAHGLAPFDSSVPRAIPEVPKNESIGQVNLSSVIHYAGVNALAENQKIEFGSNLTIVYGDNGAGKSGYTRILKTACQARGTEEILGNVIAESLPKTISVLINYTVGEDKTLFEWKQGDSLLRMVNVFDSRSASVYLKERTDVAFRPFGLDIFDKLSKACEEVKSRLDKEMEFIKASHFQLPEIPIKTEASKFVSTLSLMTKEDSVNEMFRLTDDEAKRLALLEKQIEDSKSLSPKRLLDQLNALYSKVDILIAHMRSLDKAVSDSALQQIFSSQGIAVEKSDAAKLLRLATFSEDLLSGTGSEKWKELWHAAQAFSSKHAYQDKPYPHVDVDAKCVLCQQDLDEMTKSRMDRFHKYVISKAEVELNEANGIFELNRQNLINVQTRSAQIESILQDFRTDYPEISTAFSDQIAQLETRKSLALSALQNGIGIPKEMPAFENYLSQLEELKSNISERKRQLESQKTDSLDHVTDEKNELKARKMLSPYIPVIIKEIERKRILAAYESSVGETKTVAITRKSTEVTKEIVTNKLKESFANELQSLGFDHVEVQLQEAGGERGALYHKLVLTRAPKVDVPKVASEGEARCLSIAAFFAELSTADNPSAILFDDPVSSLDHKWRSSVAKRLVMEAKTRQVIVFTHDVVFLLELHKHAETMEIELKDQHLRREGTFSGISVDEFPWKAMNVSKRINFLNDQLQKVTKLYKDGAYTDYEREATQIYGKLRETWERAFEEVLLNGSIERYRNSIQTQRAKSLSDITEGDYDKLVSGMAKSSKWLVGHDLAAAENEDIPKPDELAKDINDLIEWVAEIRKRRK